MNVHWTGRPAASGFYAAAAVLSGGGLVDAELAAALGPPARALANLVAQHRADVRSFLGHLIPLSHQATSKLDLARAALSKSAGVSAAAAAGTVAGLLGEIERVFAAAVPRLAEELALREQPIRMQWEARGPGLLVTMARLTDPDFLLPQGNVGLVHPVAGGGGRTYPAYNLVAFEAVLTDVTPGLPEVLRLAWLLAQLNLDLARYGERLDPGRQELVGGLALIPLVLFCGEQVELAWCDEPTIAKAIRAWRPEFGEQQAATVFEWWQVFLDSRPSLAGGLLALDAMLRRLPAGGNPESSVGGSG